MKNSNKVLINKTLLFIAFIILCFICIHFVINPEAIKGFKALIDNKFTESENSRLKILLLVNYSISISSGLLAYLCYRKIKK